METAHPQSGSLRQGADQTPLLLWLCLALICAAALGALLLGEPLWALAIGATVPFALATVTRPEWATYLVLFVLYSNAAVVAVRFHGVPYAAGLLAPAPLLLPLGYYLIRKRQPIVFTGTFRWILLFVFLQFASAIFSRYPSFAMKGVKESVIEGLALYLIVTNVLRSHTVLQRAIWGFLAAGVLMGGLSAFQQATSTQHINYGGFAQFGEGEGFYVEKERQRRLCGPIGEQNRYAQIMLMLVPLGLAASWNARNYWLKALALAAIACAGAGCVLTFSRGAAVAFVLMLLLMTFFGYVRPLHLCGLIVVGLAVALTIPQYRARLESIPTVLGIFQSYGSQEARPDGAIRGRATAMLAATRVCADHPLLGVGPGAFPFYTREYAKIGGLRALEEGREAHSLYLGLAAELGVSGIFAFLVAVGVSLRNLARVRRDAVKRGDQRFANTATGLLLAVISYLCTGLFLHFSFIRYFWLMLAVADSATVIRTSDDRSPIAETA